MNITIQNQQPQAAEWRDWARQRTHFVLRRMRDWVRSAHLRLSDTNGPRGGEHDKRCAIELRSEQHGTLVVSATGKHWGAAIHAALRKLARQLSRTHHRQATQPRLAVAHARISN